jgi:hypothetical protein
VTKPRTTANADDLAECEYLAAWIERNGSKRPTITQAWLADARRLKEIDGRTHQQVMACIEWCQRDSFWCTNILSMRKLRQHYDRLRMDANRSPQGKAEARRAARLAAAAELERSTG